MIVTLVLFFTACDHTGNITATIPLVVTSGTWRVSLFTDNGNDETSDFIGYNFVFNVNGTLMAVKNGTSKPGTWNANENSNKLMIDLGPKDNNNRPLGELTDDWLILSKSNTEIRLTDDNPASNEFLTFVKN